VGTILIDSHVAPRSKLLIVIVILAFAFLAPRDPRMQETPPAIIIKFVACPKEAIRSDLLSRWSHSVQEHPFID